MDIMDQDMSKNMSMKEENKDLLLFFHKACMMILITIITQVGLFRGKKMMIRFVLPRLNHIAMKVVKN
jgi:hypothetical protein